MTRWREDARFEASPAHTETIAHLVERAIETSEVVEKAARACFHAAIDASARERLDFVDRSAATFRDDAEKRAVDALELALERGTLALVEVTRGREQIGARSALHHVGVDAETIEERTDDEAR
jgi:hypothetical protein